MILHKGPKTTIKKKLPKSMEGGNADQPINAYHGLSISVVSVYWMIVLLSLTVKVGNT